jgi:hypothetical protein
MAYKVFVSYSTKSIGIAKWAIQSLSRPGITEVFVSEYSLEPGAKLTDRLLAEIRDCDVFVLLWTDSARSSDWVLQEIGAASMAKRLIVPVVLEPNLPVPGFISNLKYLRAHEDWDGSFITLKNFIDAQAMEATKRHQASIVLGLILGAIALFATGPEDVEDEEN